MIGRSILVQRIRNVIARYRPADNDICETVVIREIMKANIYLKRLGVISEPRKEVSSSKRSILLGYERKYLMLGLC